MLNVVDEFTREALSTRTERSIDADDDAGYEAWLRKQPRGFILNGERNPRVAYLLLHRASCHTISGTPSAGATWTAGGYIKVCADTLAELDLWAGGNTSGLPQRCGTCAP